MIQFQLDDGDGLSPYLQLIRQVRHALRLGLLREGDQLPTIKELAGSLAINPNTVLKAYRELEYDGLVVPQAGVGTFIRVTLADVSHAVHGPLGQELRRWLVAAREAGLDDESLEAMFSTMRRETNPDAPVAGLVGGGLTTRRVTSQPAGGV